MTTIEAYPLHWPSGWPRTAHDQQRPGRFSRVQTTYTNGNAWRRARSTTIADGVDRVLASLGRFGVRRDDIIISSNLRLHSGGFPRSGAAEPDDPGIAVYWTLDGERQCMAIDRYTRTADNLAAIAATIEAMRAIERHGGAQILARAFQGFKQLASGDGDGGAMTLSLTDAARIISDVGRGAFTPDEIMQYADEAKLAIRLALKHGHPDHPHGDAATFARVTAARTTIEAHHR